MTATYGTICLIVVVICTNFQDGLTTFSTRAEVESTFICSSKWQQLKLNSKVTHLSSNFSSFWKENEQKVKAQAVKQLLQAVIYPYNITKHFSCYGNVANYEGSSATWVNNVSFNITLPEVGSELLGVRFTSLAGKVGESRLEFYIRPKISIASDVSYNLSYCLCNNNIASIFDKDYSCPKFRMVKFSCSLRTKNVYRISNSTGRICQAFTIDYINFYSEYKFYILSTTADGSNSISTDFRIYTKQSFDPIEYPGYFTVVLMAPKPKYLSVTATEQVVELKWENDHMAEYHIVYLCSNGANSSRAFPETSVSTSIYDENFMPYIRCKFCLTTLVNAGGLSSEPLCNSTRFPEKPPSIPPKIICDFKTCKTTSYTNSTRKVKINCELPEENTRNGLLTRLVIKYWNHNNTDPFQKDFPINLTSCQVTVKDLYQRDNYFAQMSVCNSQGCSSFSETVLFAKAVQPSSRSKSKIELSWLGFLAVLVAFPVIGFVYLYCKNTPKPKPNRSLPNINEPNINCYEDVEARSNYHELPDANSNENIFDKI